MDDIEMADDADWLPSNWRRHWSNSKQQHYYYNKITRETTYKDPEEYLMQSNKERIVECFKSWGKYHIFIPDTNVFLNNWDFIEFLMDIPKVHGSIFVLKVVMKELDQREKGNAPGMTELDKRIARQANCRMARNVKSKNFTGEKTHENYRNYIPEHDDTNDDRILKAVLKKPNAFLFTNDNNLYTKASLQGVHVARPTAKGMLQEVLTNHEKSEVISNRVEATNTQREIENKKRLANMKNIEWGKSKVNRSPTSEGIFSTEYDLNDNCKLTDELVLNPSLMITLDNIPLADPKPGNENDEFEFNPNIRLPNVNIIENPVERFNDVVKERIIKLTQEDITLLNKPISNGFYKIFIGEFQKAFGFNSLSDHLTSGQIHQLERKNFIGIIELCLSKWGCVFRLIRNCNSDIKMQFEGIQKTHQTHRENIDLNWLFCVRNIFSLFRSRLDLEVELNFVQSIVEGKPIEISPRNDKRQTPSARLLSPANPSVGQSLSVDSIESYCPISPFSNSSPCARSHEEDVPLYGNRVRPPIYCINPLDAIETIEPESPKWMPVSQSPITVAKPKVHRLTASYRINPLDLVPDDTALNPMNELFTHRKSSEASSIDSFSSSSKPTYKSLVHIDPASETDTDEFLNRRQLSQEKYSEPIHPGLLARITSDY